MPWLTTTAEKTDPKNFQQPEPLLIVQVIYFLTINTGIPTAVVVDLSIVGAAEREIVGSTHDRYLVSE